MVTIQDLESQIGVYLNAVSKIPCVPMPQCKKFVFQVDLTQEGL